MEYKHTACGHVAQTVGAVRGRIRKLWPIETNDRLALFIGICVTFSNAKAVVELACSRHLAPIINSNLEGLSINSAEFVAIIPYSASCCANIASIANTEWFCSRSAKIETALVCTLAESFAAAAWQKPGVKLAVLVSFESTFPLLPTLDAILGAVVRSDSRRIEDLHFECLDETPDPTSVCQALEILCESVL